MVKSRNSAIDAIATLMKTGKFLHVHENTSGDPLVFSAGSATQFEM